jgi:FkbM family methyltransferase
MERRIHHFDNGVAVFDDHLIPSQRERYAKRNVHEAEEEDLFVELVRSLPVNGCYVDIGAAIGYYAILARKLSPHLHVHAVEPLERHRRLLRENLALNGLAESDVVVHGEAIALSEGNQNLLNRGYGSRIQRDKQPQKPSLSDRWKDFLINVGLRDLRKKQVLTIQTITLDTLLRRIGRVVDLLQMDVQGLEVEVLGSGAEAWKSSAIKKFLIGSHGAERHRQCIDILREHGYTIAIDKFDTVDQPDGIIVATL